MRIAIYGNYKRCERVPTTYHLRNTSNNLTDQSRELKSVWQSDRSFAAVQRHAIDLDNNPKMCTVFFTVSQTCGRV